MPFSSTGRGKIESWSRVCEIAMAFYPCLSRKGLPRSPPSASEVPSGFPGFEKLPHLSKSDCFPLDFGELPKPDKPLESPQDNAGQTKKSTFPRQARGKYTFGPHVARLRCPFTLPAVQEKNLPRSPPSASKVASGLPKSPPGAAEVPSGFRGFGSSQAYQHRSAFLRTLANFRNRKIRASETG